MSLIGFEGFDDMPTSGPPDEPLGIGQNASGALGFWTQAGGSVQKVTGFNSGSSAIWATSNTSCICTLNSNYTRLILGFRFLVNNITSDLITFYNGASQQCGIAINSSAHLFVYGSTGSSVLGTGATSLSIGSWYYVESDVTFNSSTGQFTVVLNGSGTEITASGINTAPGGGNQCNAFGFARQAASSNGQANYVDDLYLLDPTTGSAPLTSMLGVCRIESLSPNNTVAAGPWTVGAGASLSAAVADTASDGDTTYDVAAIAGQCTLGHGSLSSTPTTIFAAAVKALVRKDQTTNPTAQTTLVSGVTTQQGATRIPTTSYLAMRDIYTTDPNTGLAWTAAAVNSSAIGVNRAL